MAQIILDEKIVTDDWTLLSKEFNESTIAEKQIVPLNALVNHPEILQNGKAIGVWIDSDEKPEDVAQFLDKVALVAINFPKFVDGRGYSFARIIREQFHYTGQIRAIGDVLKDQIFYMKRCGFNAFSIRQDRDIEDALHGLTDFSETYQAAIDQATPLFRRRISK